MSLKNRIEGDNPIEVEEQKYSCHDKLAFKKLVDEDVVYAIRHSATKAFIYLRELIDDTNVINFNDPGNGLLILSLVQAELISLEKAEAIIGTPHDGVSE